MLVSTHIRCKCHKDIYQHIQIPAALYYSTPLNYKLFYSIPRYPCFSALPSKYKNWQLRCCEEIYNGIGTQGIKSYSENGLSWTRDSGYISYELREEIEPMVGYIVGSVE